MPTKTLVLNSLPRFAACLLLMVVFAHESCVAAVGQQPADDPQRARALKLYESSNYTEALPLLEKLAAANPTDIGILSRLGFALYASATAIKDPVKRKAGYERARQILIKSRDLGDDSNLTRGTLDALASPDPTEIPLSNIREAEKAIREGEEAFVRGELDQALASYERALKLDPKLYEAALFAGDMYFKKGHLAPDGSEKYDLMNKAGEWFAKAVQINPDRETAHRYWGDALMMGQNKREESRQKFAEAIVAEPYNRRAWVGLIQWSERYRIKLGHPRIEPPANVSPLKDNRMSITIDPKSLEDKGDGSSAWMLYGITRAAWAMNKFAREFPSEKAYRHSLREEAEALSSVATVVKQQMKEGKIKQIDPMIERLVKLHDEGLVEAFVLFARANQGIARDYGEYRKMNREKLRRYLLEYVSSGP
ncbi:MAG: tetratricopeptide repeat protein [Pyrinomonadaceae bacterium]